MFCSVLTIILYFWIFCAHFPNILLDMSGIFKTSGISARIFKQGSAGLNNVRLNRMSLWRRTHSDVGGVEEVKDTGAGLGFSFMPLQTSNGYLKPSTCTAVKAVWYVNTLSSPSICAAAENEVLPLKAIAGYNILLWGIIFLHHLQSFPLRYMLHEKDELLIRCHIPPPPPSSLFENAVMRVIMHAARASCPLQPITEEYTLSMHDDVTLWLSNVIRERSVRKGRIWVMMAVITSTVGMLMTDVISWIKWHKMAENYIRSCSGLETFDFQFFSFMLVKKHSIKKCKAKALGLGQPMQKELKGLSFKARQSALEKEKGADAVAWQVKTTCLVNNRALGFFQEPWCFFTKLSVIIDCWKPTCWHWRFFPFLMVKLHLCYFSAHSTNVFRGDFCIIKTHSGCYMDQRVTFH